MTNNKFLDETNELSKLLDKLLNLPDHEDIKPLKKAFFIILINEPATSEMITKMVNAIQPVIAEYLGGEPVTIG